MVTIYNKSEIKKIKKSCQIVVLVLKELGKMIKPGISTYDLDTKARELIKEHKATPAFLGYSDPPYPSVICTSVNNAVVHEIPDKNKILKDGDIITIDLGVKKKGFFGDAAITYEVGEPSPMAKKLIATTKQALDEAIKYCVEGYTVGDVSSAIQSCAEANGYSPVRGFTGHGIGKKLHEYPPIFNFGEPNTGDKLQAGMVLAIEPILCIGNPTTTILSDNWTAVTCNGNLCAHFEHTIVVGKSKAQILTKK